MTEVPQSRYESARALEALAPEKRPESNAVRFHAGGFAVSKIRPKADAPIEAVLRYPVHCGHAVEIALSPHLAAQLGAALLQTFGGSTPPPKPSPETPEG